MAASKFKNGMKVRQIMPAPEEGHIVDIGIDKESGDRLFLVAWLDGEGNELSGWYKEDEIEQSLTPAPEEEEEEEPASASGTPEGSAE
jgi:hypothetical protein